MTLDFQAVRSCKCQHPSGVLVERCSCVTAKAQDDCLVDLLSQALLIATPTTTTTTTTQRAAVSSTRGTSLVDLSSLALRLKTPPSPELLDVNQENLGVYCVDTKGRSTVEGISLSDFLEVFSSFEQNYNEEAFDDDQSFDSIQFYRRSGKLAEKP